MTMSTDCAEWSGCARLRVRLAWRSGAVLAAGCASGQPAAPARHPGGPAVGDRAGPPRRTTSPAATKPEAEGVLAPPDRARATPSPTTPRWPRRARRSRWSPTTAAARPRSASTSTVCYRTGATPRTRTSTPCGPTGDAAGPHFQNQVDPAAAPGKPSTDPAYANPQNEIWLDLRTDGDGDGEVESGGAVRVHRPGARVGRHPRGRDDGDRARPGRHRRSPAGLHHGAVPVGPQLRRTAQSARPHTRKAGRQHRSR